MRTTRRCLLVAALLAAGCATGGEPDSGALPERASTTSTTSGTGALTIRRDLPVEGATTADVIAPVEAADLPVIVLFHGTEGVRQRMERLAEHLAASGAVVVVTSWPVLMERPEFDTTEDVYFEQTSAAVCSVRFARSIAADHGGDPDDITLLGHSGGAPIAARVALAHDPPWPGIDCFPGVSSRVTRLVGTAGDFVDEYQYGSWIPDVHRPYDVFRMEITNHDLEVLLFQGIDDLNVPSWVPASFDDHLDGAGLESRLLYVDGGHGELIDPRSPVGEFVADEVAAMVHGGGSVTDRPADRATVTFDGVGCRASGGTTTTTDRLFRLALVNDSSVAVWFWIVGLEAQTPDAVVAELMSRGPTPLREVPPSVQVAVYELVDAGVEADMEVVFVRDEHRWITYCMPAAESGHEDASSMFPGDEIVVEG